jgi:transcriptional regulator with GAF, ATPase, and Fis domain
MARNAENNSQPLEAFHDLLPTLAGTLDVGEIFEHLSRVAAQIVPHDEANLALLTEDGAQYLEYVAGRADGRLISRSNQCPLRNLDEAQLVNSLAGNGPFRAGISAPVRIADQAFGVFALLAHRPGHYSSEDLAIVQWLADYLAITLSHQRLAESARRAAVDRERITNIESSMELLRTISSVLDIRTVFPQISEIANKMLTHDFLTMSFHDLDGTILIEAASGSDLPELRRIVKPGRSHPPERFLIVDDFAISSVPVIEPPGFQEIVLAAGFRSLLTVQASAGAQEIGVGFWSKKPSAFALTDVPVARRIADHVTLAVSHEQLATAARAVAEAQARAERLESRVHALTSELTRQPGPWRVVGHSEEWLDVLRKATQVAATDTTVLLSGESGTGKEVVARFIHRASARADGPFVALNCAALPEQLLESELFGHERGAFTGAHQAKPGQIELAAGGVLFLDEVTEMSLSAQAKFLRVLQEREFQRLGGTRRLTANVRVLAATNRTLRDAVSRGDFREDLYYRLQVFEIKLAPLRERTGDILPLSDAFLQQIGRAFGRPPAGLTRDARDALLQYDWPGNVRELHNALERAAILCQGGLITAQHLMLEGASRPVTAPTTDLPSVERATIAQVLREVHWNKSLAARRLGLSRTQLYIRLRKYGLERSPEERV